jgi:hypothetical protein
MPEGKNLNCLITGDAVIEIITNTGQVKATDAFEANVYGPDSCVWM